MKLFVDHSASIAEATYVSDFPTADAITKLFEAFADTPFTPSYDWLVDMRAITSDISEDELLAVASAWNDLAKGRDVGRRTAIVCNSTLVGRMSNTLVDAMPFRFVSIFTDRDEAIIWLRAPRTEAGSDYQFI